MGRKKRIVHRSTYFERTKEKDSLGKREKIYAKAWEGLNKPMIHIAFTRECSMLEMLMSKSGTVPTVVTQEMATAAATVFQWLAAPNGFFFFEGVLKKAGYCITKIKQNSKKPRK